MLLKKMIIKGKHRYKLDIDEVKRGDCRLIKPFPGSKILTNFGGGNFVHNGNGHTYYLI